MKRLYSFLLALVVLCSMSVSCGKEDIRDQLNPLDVEGPEGTLEINDWDLYLKNGHAKLYATYRNGDGLYRPEKISVTPGNIVPDLDGDHAVFEFTVPGSYTVCAGSLSIDIKVMKY